MILTCFFASLFLAGMAITGFFGVAVINTEDADVGTTLTTQALTYEDITVFGGTNYDDGFDITTDGTFLYIAGITKKTGDYDVVLIKCDPDGNQLWNKTWGGPGTETVSAIALDSSGNIYLTGMTSSYGPGTFNMFIVKYTSGGIKDWNYTWGHTNGIVPMASGNGLLVQYPGYIYVVGSTNKAGNYDILVVKYDNGGAELWNYTWGSTETEHGYDITMDTNGKLYLIGSTEGYGSEKRDLVIVRITAGSPSYEDHETWGGTEDDYGNSVVIVANQLYIAGGTESYGAGGADVAVLRYDQSLNRIWAKTYGGTGNSNESAADITHYNGSLIITGNEELTKIILVQFLTNGDYIDATDWSTGGDESAGGVTVLPTGEIFVVGTTDGLSDPLSDIILLEFSATYAGFPGGGIPAFSIQFLVVGLLISVGLIILLRKNQRFLQTK